MSASPAPEHREATDFIAAAYRPGRDEAGLEAIEKAADRVLEETGIRFLDDPETIDILKQAGGIATGDVVRLDGAELRRIVRRHASAWFLLRARNPTRDTSVGEGAAPVFAPIYGAPNVVLDNGARVAGDRRVYRELVGAAHAAGEAMLPMNGLSEQVRCASSISSGRRSSATSSMTQIICPVLFSPAAACAAPTSSP